VSYTTHNLPQPTPFCSLVPSHPTTHKNPRGASYTWPSHGHAGHGHTLLLPLSSLHSSTDHLALLPPLGPLSKLIRAISRKVDHRAQASTRPRRTGATGAAWPCHCMSADARTAANHRLAAPLHPWPPLFSLSISAAPRIHQTRSQPRPWTTAAGDVDTIP
jgi:hypothetical protein